MPSATSRNVISIMRAWNTTQSNNIIKQKEFNKKISLIEGEQREIKKSMCKLKKQSSAKSSYAPKLADLDKITKTQAKQIKPRFTHRDSIVLDMLASHCSLLFGTFLFVNFVIFHVFSLLFLSFVVMPFSSFLSSHSHSNTTVYSKGIQINYNKP